MKKFLFMAVMLVASTLSIWAQETAQPTLLTPAQQEIIDLSHKKWDWMSEKNADALAQLFHHEAVFVNMGGAWG